MVSKQFHYSITLSWPWLTAEIVNAFKTHPNRFKKHFNNGTFGSQPEGQAVMAFQSFQIMPLIAFFLEVWNFVIVPGSFWYLFIMIPLLCCAGMLMYEHMKIEERGDVQTTRQQIYLVGAILLPAVGWWITFDFLHAFVGYLKTTWLGGWIGV